MAELPSTLVSVEVLVVNIETDVAQILIDTPTNTLVTSESESFTSLQIKLLSQPTHKVQIPMLVSNPALSTLQPDQITFTPNNWNLKAYL